VRTLGLNDYNEIVSVVATDETALSHRMPAGGVTVVIVAVTEPDFLVRPETIVTRPKLSVFPDEVPEIRPDHAIVTEAPDTGRPA